MNLLGGDTLLWRGGLNVGRTQPRNLRPVAGADAILVVAGGTATIPVLDNDMDPEGEPLKVVKAAAQSGSVAIEADGTLTYTAPPDLSGTDIVTYTVADPHNATDEGTVAVDIIILSIVQGSTAEEFVVSAAPGMLTVTISEPEAYRGEYPISTADLESGPFNLVPPKLVGTGAVGETLSASGGLWAFDETTGPLGITRQWLRNGEPIPEATSASHIVAAEDTGQELSLQEQGTSSGGTRSATSGPITVAEHNHWSPASLPALALWLDASDPSTITASGSEVISWADKSGNDRHATRAFAAGPAVGTINGRTALDIGIDQALTIPASGIAGGADRSVVMAVGPFAYPTSRSFFTLGGGDNTGAGRRWSFRSDSDKVRIEINSGFIITQVDAAAGGVVGAYHSGPTFAGTALSRDGTYHSGVTSNTTALSTLDEDALIGLRGSNLNGNAAGLVGEVILCAAILTENDRQKVEGYLAHKWGFAGLLPANHPFKTSPPLA